MDKKVLTGLVNDIVEAVRAKNGLEEGEARTLVGICLRKNKDAIVAAVINPLLVLASAPTPPVA